jgi:hypothetical protein
VDGDTLVIVKDTSEKYLKKYCSKLYWRPVEIIVEYEKGPEAQISLDFESSIPPWDTVSSWWRRYVTQNGGSAPKTIENGWARTGFYEPYKGRKRKLYRGCDVFHPAVEDVLRDSYDGYNAVLITPNSAIDKAVEKVYSYGKTLPKETEDE